MSRILKSKKRFVLGVVASLAIAAVAFAYWTTSGTGDGTATTGTDQGVTVTGDPADGLYPGGSVAVTTNIDNDSADQSQHVNYLHVTITTDAVGCDAADFTYQADEEVAGSDSNPHSVLLDEEIAGGADLDVPGTVFMENTAVDQDACKNADIDLAYAVNNTP